MLSNQIHLHYNYYSNVLANSRDIVVYVPPDYESNGNRRYPVLYMQDGQNLFDEQTSFAGVSWKADETAQSLILAGKIEPLIIVGIYNSGLHRINEYTPSPGFKGQGGAAERYGNFLIQELKPFIDNEYRTLTGHEFTGVGGSSLGGLVSLYLGLRRSDVFSRVAAISPSIWWGSGEIIREFNYGKANPALKIWLDIGSGEGRRIKTQMRLLRDVLIHKGWKRNSNFFYLEARRGRHDEHHWGARFDRVLLSLYGKKNRTGRISLNGSSPTGF